MKKRLFSIILMVALLFPLPPQCALIDAHAASLDVRGALFCNSDVEAYSDEWCYYVDVENGTGIYRESYEKENRELIFHEPVKEIALCNNLLFISYLNKNEIGAIDLDKNEMTYILAAESRIYRFAVSEDKIYYLCDETIFCCPKLGGNTTVILQAEGLSRFWFTDENAFEYILDDESIIYSYDIKNEKTTHSYQNNITNLENKSEYKSTTRGVSLAGLKTKFPHGKYWNHVGGSNNPDGYTSTPCTCHGSCNYYGYCNCNSFSNAIQCYGFALKVGYDYYGSDPRNWGKVYNLNSLKAGDVIRYKNNGHSIWVTAVNGDTITYADCNSTGRCQIRWGATISKSTVLATLTHVSVAPYTVTSTVCSTHTKGTYLWYEAAHPHYNYWTCSVCGTTFTDGSTEFLESCTECVSSSIERHSVMDAWFSKEKMGESTTVEYKGSSIYLCYKLYDTNTGDLFDSYRSNFDYTVKETVYNPDGSVLFSYTYTNDNNWIRFTPTENGVYTAEVTYTPSGGSPTTVHRSFTSTNVISKDIWVSETPMGEEVSALLTGREYYLNYKMYDSETGDLFNIWNIVLDSYGTRLEVKGPSTTVENTFYNEDTGSLAFTVNETGSYTLSLYGINGSSPMETETLTARNAKIYGVRFDANGGSGEPRIQKFEENSSTTIPDTVPTRFGYNFLGWSTSSTAISASYRPGDIYTANANTTLYAVWSQATTITTTTEYAAYATITYPGVGLYYKFSPSVTTSYRIYGADDIDNKVQLYDANGNLLASDDDSGGNSQFQLDYVLTSGQTYYFYVSPYSSTATDGFYFALARGYSVTYNANGGSGAPGITNKYYGVETKLSTIVPVRNGYTFLGWSTSSSATTATYLAGDSFKTNADTTLYAVWSANTYTITYNANGGTGAPSSQAVVPGTNSTLSSAIPSRFGYSFRGWSTSATASSASYHAGDSFSANANTTLYAVWESASEISGNYGSWVCITSICCGGAGVYYKFIPNDNTYYRFYGTAEVDSVIHIYDANGNLLAEDDDSGEGNQFQLDYCFTAGETYFIYVRFYSSSKTGSLDFKVARGYKISYDANGGSGAPGITYNYYGFDATLSTTIPVRNGYTFLGWSISGSDTTAAYLPGSSFTTNIDRTLYAVWKANTYTITYDANGGSGAPSSQTKIHDQPLTLSMVIPTRTKYTFLGWSTSSSATTATYPAGGSFTTNANTTLYAVWREHTHEYDAVVTAPTCTTQGYTTHTCSSCGDSYKDTYTAALGHNYSYKVTTMPTASATGVLTGTCSRCSGTTTVTLPKLNTTDYSYSVVKAATCIATGTGRYTWKTTTYGSYYFDVTLAKTAHNYSATVTAPTCTAQGYTTHTCTACGDSYKDTYVDALGHAWDGGKVTTQPTATESGVKTFTCTRCGATRTQTIPATGEQNDDTCNGGATCPGRNFTDMPAPTSWMHAGIDFAVENNLFLGTSDTTFSPNASMTRAMLVTVLWRLDGKPEAGTQTAFRDVPESEYYAQPVAWASANGIVMGTSTTTFSPNGKITREQMAAILFRYAQQKGYDTSRRAELSKFPDNGRVSDYAKEALAWANAEGLINGDEQANGTVLLDPAGNATRAQVAAILMRYVENIVK